MVRVLRAVAVLGTLSCGLNALGCGGSGATPLDSDAGARDAGPTGAGADAGAVDDDVALRIEPSATELLLAADTDRPTVAHRLLARGRDGSERVITGGVTWTSTTIAGSVDSTGLFTASGRAGDVATITARLADGRTAQATVSVTLHRMLSSPVSAADIAAFDARTTGADVSISYPLDHVVFPQNVVAAELQWSAGFDVVRISLEKPHFRAVRYMEGDAHTFERDVWRQFALSDGDAEGTITVESAPSVKAIVHVRFARAALTGSVYYWSVSDTRLYRIDDGTSERVDFMPNPPDGALELPDRTYRQNCIGCHSVSKSGRWMAARLGGGDNVGAIFDLTRDLRTTLPARAETAYPVNDDSPRWWFSSWAPDDTRMVVSWDEWGNQSPTLPGPRLRIFEPFASPPRYVDPEGMPEHATHPAWSPLGGQIAFAWNVVPFDSGLTGTGDIAVLDISEVSTVSAPRIIHHGTELGASVEGGEADAYPTWSPDAARIVFQHGSDTSRSTSPTGLYVIAPDGTGLARLDRAMGGESATDSSEPRFSPFDRGGYYWLMFLSRRRYGERSFGSPQIWVSAIRKEVAPGEDPSEVPYWLPGQDVSSNIAAQWAERACRVMGTACEGDGECCSGACQPPATGGAPVCSPPPPDVCRTEGQTCEGEGSCCDGLQCIGRVCVFDLI